jgi:hypothetical protein
MTNYRLPDNCCLNCTHSYNNSYGDNQCYTSSGKIVDAGGYCDEYERTIDVPVVRELPEVKPAPWEGYTDCTGCIYLFVSAMDTAICALNNKPAERRCKRFELIKPQYETTEEITLTTEDAELIDTVEEPHACKECAFAFYKEQLPWCKQHDVQIDSEECCDSWAQEGSVVIIDGTCELCEYSFLDEQGHARCACDNAPIYDVHDYCDRYKEANFEPSDS